MTVDVDKRFYTPTEAAASLGIGMTWVYAELNNGRLSSIKIGRKRLIPSAELDAYAELLIAEARIVPGKARP